MGKIILLLCLVIIMGGCKANSPLEPKTSKPPALSAWNPSTSAYGWMQATLMRYELKNNSYADRSLVTGFFYDSVGGVSLAGGLALDSNTVPVLGSEYYSTSGPTFGGTQTWSVTSSSTVPAFSKSIASPSPFRTTAPRSFTDSVSMSAGFVISYSSPGTDSVIYAVTYDSVKSYLADTTTHNGFHYVWNYVPNTGTIVIPSALLSSWPTHGIMRITIAAARTASKLVGSKTYVLRSAVGSTTFCYIKS